MARSQSLALLLACAIGIPAQAGDLCRSQSDGVWSGTPPFDGTVVWSCTGGDGTPGSEDDYTIDHHVVIEGALFAAGDPSTGRIRVRGRLDLSSAEPVSVHAAGPVRFEDGSDGRWQGFELEAAAVPAVRFPSPTTIRLDFDEALLPWRICDPAGTGTRCSSATVHPADLDPGERRPPTQIYLDFEKFEGLAAPTPDAAAPISDWLVDGAGVYLEVAAAIDGDGNGILDSLVLALPTSGDEHGWRHMGSDGEAVLDPNAREGRCEECFEQGVPAGVCGGQPGGGRFSHGDPSGCQLRNAVGEGAWMVSATTPWREALSATRQRRWEVLVSADAFDTDGEFEGYLLCLPAGPSEWCARIAASVDGAGPASEDALVVLRDPAGAIAPGAVANVYYVRPFPGDRLVPVNMHYWNGGEGGSLFSEEGSLLGISHPLHAIHFDELTNPVGIRARNVFGWQMDLVLMEHFGSDRAGGVGFLLLSSEGNQATEADGVDVRRLTCRFPDQNVAIDNVGGDVGGGAECVKTKTEHPALAGTPDVWQAVTFRKVRGEGMLETLNLNEPAFSDCVDGLLVQDLLVLHKLLAHPTLPSWNNESLELRGGQRRCAIDRIAFAGTASGSDVITRCHNCDPGFGVEITSVVCLGSSAGTGVGSCVGANDSAAGRSRITNWLTNRSLKHQNSFRYGALVGHFSDGGLGGLAAGCQDAVGTYAVGGTAPGEWKSPCDGSQTQRWADDVWLHQNAGAARWIGASGLAPAELIVERTLFHTAAEAVAPGFVRIDASAVPTVIRLRSGVVESDRDGAGAAVMLQPVAGLALEIGPLWFASGRLRCHELGGGASIWRGGALDDGCRPTDAFAADGDGSDEGWSRSREDILEVGRFGFVASPWAYGFESMDRVAPGCDAQRCPLIEALPRWAGPVAYDWPLVWATAQPLPGFHRTSPEASELPALLAGRLAPACDNGRDDDGDLRADAQDPGCEGSEDLSERSAVWPCDDGLDNDGDGRIDVADPECTEFWPYTEQSPAVPSCSLGPGLLLLLPGLVKRRRRGDPAGFSYAGGPSSRAWVRSWGRSGAPRRAGAGRRS